LATSDPKLILAKTITSLYWAHHKPEALKGYQLKPYEPTGTDSVNDFNRYATTKYCLSVFPLFILVFKSGMK